MPEVKSPRTRNGNGSDKNRRIDECSECETTLRHSKEAGYPHPGDWPHTDYRPVVSYLRLRLEKYSRNGFLSNRKSGLHLFSERVISLRDMQRYATEKLVHIMYRFGHVKEMAAHHMERQYLWPDNERNKSQVELRETLPWLEELSLGTTKGLLEQLAADLPHLDIRTVLGKLNQIETVLEYELKARMFFVLDVSDTGRYNNLLLAGERFKDNWPRSNGELIEAGNCFSVACYTGCVCHLMRSLEYALRAFEAALKITAPPPGPGNTWGNILGRIEVKKGKGNTKPSPEWIADAAFYDDCLSFFWAVKSACRDKTFHVESSYDKSSAKPLFDCTVAILSKISEHLNEIK